MPCVDICNGTLLDTLNRKNPPLRQIHPIASVAQIESGIEDLPGILTIDAGIMGIQIKYTASKAASGTPEDILLQMDIQMLLIWIIVTARTWNIIGCPTVFWHRIRSMESPSRGMQSIPLS